MRKISKIVEKSNLTPRERILLIIQSWAKENTTGKPIFSEDEIEELSRPSARTRYDANEYNKYLRTWEMFRYLEIDMQSLFLSFQLNIGNLRNIFSLYTNNKQLEHLENIFQKNNIGSDSAFDYILKNTGLAYEETIHKYTFLSLPKDIQDDLIKLDYESQWEYQYLSQEEILAEIIRGRTKLPKDDMKRLTTIITESLPWDLEERWRKVDKKLAGRLFSGYFANYSIIEFGKKILEERNILFDEDNEKEIKEKLMKIKITKKDFFNVVYKAIEDGLFLTYNTPLYISESYETYSGEDTNLPHNKLFDIWMNQKKKTLKLIERLKNEKGLEIKEIKENIRGFEYKRKIIIGESIYKINEKISFIDEYKKQVDDIKIYGYIFKLIEESDILKQYGYLLKYKEITDKLSSIIGEKMSNKPEEFLSKIDELIDLLNLNIRFISNDISDFSFEKMKYIFHLETFFEKFIFDLTKTKPIFNRVLREFDKEASRKLGNEWEQQKKKK